MKPSKETNPLIGKLLDPRFYLESFTKIKGKTPGLRPFILNPAQLDLYNALNKHSRVMICKARQIGFCLSPETRVLTSDYNWVTLDDIKLGQEIIAVDEGMGGGHGRSRKMRKAIVENKFDVFEPAFRLKMSNGETLIATAPHRFLGKVRGAVHTVWRKVEDTKIGDEIRVLTKTWGESTYEDGWFGGVSDGEASLSKKTRTGVGFCVSQVEGYVLDRILKYVTSKGFKYRLEWDKRKCGMSSKFGDKPVCKVFLGSMSELFQVLGQCRPSRFMNRDWWTGKNLPGNGESWARVVSIESIGVRRMIDLQTSAKTYIAEGFVSHNSTAATAYLYHMAITTPGINVALIGYNSDLTAELLDKVKTFYRTTPIEMRPKIQYNSKYEISFPSLDSKILVLPSTENVGRGYTLHAVLLTELAFWDKAEEKMLAIENAVPADGKIIIESTPASIGNLYHRMWMADNGYCKKEYGWWWHYTEEEIEVIRRRINNPMRFAQEYSLEFLSSGRPVFDPMMVKRIRKGILKVGDKSKMPDGSEYIVSKDEDGLTIYFKPVPGRKYVAGVDVAEGVMGGDFSVFVVWDRETGDEVAMWRGYLPPDRFGASLDKWGRLFNDALMVVEINNHGLTTVTTLRNLQYPQMYFRPVKFDQMGTSYSDRIGWKTTKVTRPLMIDDFRESLQDGSIKVHSENTIDEMLTFVFNDDGNMVTSSSFHDDCIFASAIGFQGFKIMYSGKLEQIDYEKHLPASSSY